MADVEFSKDALLDIEEIRQYISENLCNELAANRIVTKIITQAKKLALFPFMGTELKMITGVNDNRRFLVCGNYLLFYKVQEDVIRVIRIVYGRRDYIRVLFDNT